MKKTLVAGALVLSAASVSIHAQKDWAYYGQDQGATRFSTLAQITTDNVTTLTRAWTFHTGDTSGFFESTPLVIDSVMYFASGSAFFALDAVTGQQIWKVPAVRTTRRGVSYWAGDAKTPPRIIASAGTELFALDAKTGAAIADFGDEGSVELEDSMNSPAAIYKDLAIVQGNKPWIRAFNIRSGKLEWTFNLIPQPGEKGHDTWDGESWKTAGGTNVWGLLSLDAPRGLVFLPVSMPGNNDYYGGDHHGDNLFGTSVVAVEAASGRLRWYRQLVHHDIWDYDLGAAPTLVDVVKNGRTIPAVAEITKMGLMFVLDRTTGEPVWGIEERPVPQTTAPGEKTAPTQPFPVKPPPLARNSMTKAELATITPEHEAYCKALWDKYKLQDSAPYQPWNDKQDIVLFPGAVGGGNWNGVTVNTPLGLMITNVMNAGQWGHLELGAGGRGRRGEGRGGAQPAAGRGAVTHNDETAPPAQTWRKVTPEGRRFWDPKTMYSCQAPPWGELIAVSTKTGDIAWRAPLGSFDALDAKGIKTGTPGLGGAITTAGNLVFIGATVDSKFRAFDARNGRELWSDKVEAPAHAIPSTYMGRDGKQYVVIAAGGGGFLQSPTSDTVVAYALK
ncbi:MAG TPA: PQQ-binding-like beta-propeller repeat protein [Vicinamibacterales bacterium]|nr:PQQ-binding-like beta-propeller repeat protein [Vicinamibacterales bacterium]